MKKLFATLRRFNPWQLRTDLKLLKILAESAHEALAKARQDIRNQEREIGRMTGRRCNESAALRKEIAYLKEQFILLQSGEQTARAMLMQLRVHQESVRHRTGYMVSAFVPQGVVEKLIHRGPECQRDFGKVIAEALVMSALNGIYKRSAATGKLTALIFSPLGQNVELVGGIYETNEKPVFVGMRAATGDEQKLLQ